MDAPSTTAQAICALDGYQKSEVVNGLDALFRLSGDRSLDPADIGKLARMAAACPPIRELMIALALGQHNEPSVITGNKIFVGRDGPLTLIGVAKDFGAAAPDLRFRLTRNTAIALRDALNERIAHAGGDPL